MAKRYDVTSRSETDPSSEPPSEYVFRFHPIRDIYIFSSTPSTSPGYLGITTATTGTSREDDRILNPSARKSHRRERARITSIVLSSHAVVASSPVRQSRLLVLAAPLPPNRSRRPLNLLSSPRAGSRCPPRLAGSLGARNSISSILRPSHEMVGGGGSATGRHLRLRKDPYGTAR